MPKMRRYEAEKLRFSVTSYLLNFVTSAFKGVNAMETKEGVKDSSVTFNSMCDVLS